MIQNFFRAFIPSYTEITLYTMSIAVVVVFLGNVDIFVGFYNDAIEIAMTGNWILILLLIPVAGLLLSLYHALSSRRKTIIEKKIMLWFAVSLSVLTVLLYFFARMETTGTSFILPFWNICYAFFLIMLLKKGYLNEEAIRAQETHKWEIMLSTIIVLSLYVVSQYVFLHHWVLTLSLLVGFAPLTVDFFTQARELFTR